MITKARFIGTDKSLGYRTNGVYVFDFCLRTLREPPHSDVIVIKPEGERPPVAYSNLRNFLNNWIVL